MKTAAIIALAGIASIASAQSAHVMLTHDQGDGEINIGESAVWTLSVAFTGGDTASGGNMEISGDNALGNSSSMTYTATNGGSNGGASNGAGIGFVNWTNSLFLEAFGGGAADRTNPFVVGTFSFTGGAVGTLDYTFTLGEATSAFASVAISAFADFNMADVGAAGLTITSDSLNIVPTPASAALLGLGGLVAIRRRR